MKKSRAEYEWCDCGNFDPGRIRMCMIDEGH
jgi:hypothetical protein